LLGINRALGNRTTQAHCQFRSIKAFPAIITFYHSQILVEDFFYGAETMPARLTFSSSSRRRNLTGPRFQDLDIKG
jgi:hypothetical protein